MKRCALVALAGALACTSARAPAPPPATLSLVEAVRADDTVRIGALLDAGTDPNAPAPDGTRPLTEAARHGRVAAARLLLRGDARMDLADSAGNRPWDYAIALGHSGVAAELAWQAARIAGTGPDVDAWFAWVASDTGHPLPWARVLDGELESYGLLFAVLNHRTAVVASMRRGGGIPNRSGITPLAMAARFGHDTEVAALLAGGANPDLAIADRWKSTPLMEAARDGQVEIGRRLLRAGARIDHPDIDGGTALHWAVRAGETDFARMLLDAGADPTIRDRAGMTALDLARSINHADLIALLEAHRTRRRAR